MYCCESCRKDAFNSYHRTECRMILFYERPEVDAREQMAMRTFLTGTEQGALLPNFKKKFKMRNIFSEKVDPVNQPFQLNYLATLKLSRKFDAELIKKSILSAVEAVIFLLRLKFFQNDSLPVSSQQSKV